MNLQAIYAHRRKALWQSVQSNTGKRSAIIIFAALEPLRVPFFQDNTFYYLTGIQEPGCVLVIDEQGRSHLYVPQTTIDRSVWLVVSNPDDIDQLSGPYVWHSLGQADNSYSLSWYAQETCYAELIAVLQEYIAQGVQLVGVNRATQLHQNQREFLHKISNFLKISVESFADCSDIIGSLRRRKDAHEIELLRKAIAITAKAHNDAQHGCRAVGISEAYIKASLEAVMVAHGATMAFPSIVATGVNATVLHYTGASGVLAHGDLVVIDIGASYQQYAADITRTYAVSGIRTARQDELYKSVLEVQQEIAVRAKPGVWLRNGNYPEQSLQHIAVELFKKHGLDQYFVHGIGHYLGLDVHDVGSYEEPLQPGDVITIEPGLYLRNEAIGIRIEDNYLITETGIECLSAAIPK